MSARTTRKTRMLDEILERGKADPVGAARELGRGLMRGNREDHKLGYSARSAAIAAGDMLGLDAEQRESVTTHLIGFALGMDEDDSVYPAGI